MNIYVRLRDYDLFKYLNDSEMAEVMPVCHKQQLNTGDWLVPADNSAIILLDQGRLERISAHGKHLGELSEGEMDFEAALFAEHDLPYRLLAITDAVVYLFPLDKFRQIQAPTIRAKILAAINDGLCLKTVKLTHLDSTND
jgi:signal-transduction protein with cAMP-binding, CBS, and nucleotidyltransferase domain